MPVYIALLRGINVSGKNLIKMADLRATASFAWGVQAQTYLQSGNLIWKGPDADPEVLAQQLETALLQLNGITSKVLVFEAATWKSIAKACPFHSQMKSSPNFCYFTCTKVKVDPALMPIWQEKANQAGCFEEFACEAQTVYMYCPKGYGQTKWTNTAIEKALDTVATTRNAKTVEALLQMAQELETLD